MRHRVGCAPRHRPVVQPLAIRGPDGRGDAAELKAGETFIVWDAGTPAATITVDRWANPDLWTPAEAAEPALYAHKLPVVRAYAGRGLGAELLDWAGTRAADSGATWFRLDVWTTNHELQHYYLEQRESALRLQTTRSFSETGHHFVATGTGTRTQ
jgi:GNAT superfamily N-acetyltransferase